MKQNNGSFIEEVRKSLLALTPGSDAILPVEPAPTQGWLSKHANRVAEGVAELLKHAAIDKLEALRGAEMTDEDRTPLLLALGQEGVQTLNMTPRETKLLGFVYTAPRAGVGGHNQQETQEWGDSLLTHLWRHVGELAHQWPKRG